MERHEKLQFVKEWSEEIKNIPHAILVDYRGLTVADVTDLRAKIRETESIYKVVKNNLAKLSIPGTQLEGLADYFVGPSAIAYHQEDPVSMAKVLINFAKDHPNLEIKAGVIDGKLIDPDQIKELAKMPSREELLGKLLYVMKYPVQGFVSALNNIIRNLAGVLSRVAKNKE